MCVCLCACLIKSFVIRLNVNKWMLREQCAYFECILNYTITLRKQLISHSNEWKGALSRERTARSHTHTQPFTPLQSHSSERVCARVVTSFNHHICLQLSWWKHLIDMYADAVHLKCHETGFIPSSFIHSSIHAMLCLYYAHTFVQSTSACMHKHIIKTNMKPVTIVGFCGFLFVRRSSWLS